MKNIKPPIGGIFFREFFLYDQMYQIYLNVEKLVLI